MKTPYAAEKILEKIQECESNHQSCRKSGPSVLPLRVIDITQDRPRLLETSGQIESYTALSYIWGMEAQPVMTTQANLQSLTRALPVADLPQTIKDAIFVTKNIGIRYLWVDSLCIIQDSKIDKEQQLREIPR